MKSKVIIAVLGTFFLVSCGRSLTQSDVKSSTNSGAQSQNFVNSQKSAEPIPASTAQKPSDVKKSDIVHYALLGRIGESMNSPSFIHLNLSRGIRDDKIEGTYYYDKYKTNIKLVGSLDKSGRLKLNEFDEKGKNTGTFDGKSILAGQFEGTWTNGKKQLPFILIEEPGSESKTIKSEKKQSFYEKYNDKILSEADGRRIPFPQVRLSGKNNKSYKSIEEKINRSIEDIFLKHVEEQGRFVEGYKVEHFNEMLFSMSISGDYSGGAYPSKFKHCFHFNLETGEELTFQDIIRKDKNYMHELVNIIKVVSKDNRADLVAYNLFDPNVRLPLEKRLWYDSTHLFMYQADNKFVFINGIPHVAGDYLEVKVPIEFLRNIFDNNSYFWKASILSGRNFSKEVL